LRGCNSALKCREQFFGETLKACLVAVNGLLLNLKHHLRVHGEQALQHPYATVRLHMNRQICERCSGLRDDNFLLWIESVTESVAAALSFDENDSFFVTDQVDPVHNKLQGARGLQRHRIQTYMLEVDFYLDALGQPIDRMTVGPVVPLFWPFVDLLVRSFKIHRIFVELVVQGRVHAAVSIPNLALVANFVHEMLKSDSLECFLVQEPGKVIKFTNCTFCLFFALLGIASICGQIKAALNW
jgi:hypothetical protein